MHETTFFNGRTKYTNAATAAPENVLALSQVSVHVLARGCGSDLARSEILMPDGRRRIRDASGTSTAAGHQDVQPWRAAGAHPRQVPAAGERRAERDERLHVAPRSGREEQHSTHGFSSKEWQDDGLA